jgi:hypothetical protein
MQYFKYISIYALCLSVFLSSLCENDASAAKAVELEEAIAGLGRMIYYAGEYDDDYMKCHSDIILRHDYKSPSCVKARAGIIKTAKKMQLGRAETLDERGLELILNDLDIEIWGDK